MKSALAVLMLMSAATSAGEQRPDVQKFLKEGQLSRGEQALSQFLSEHPEDDEARFGLGVMQLVRGVERLGQALHRYGVQPTRDLFLRLPVPENDSPTPINNYRFRQMLDDFGRDLMLAEATLARIESNGVRLSLQVAEIRLDFDADGKSTDRFGDVLAKLMNDERFQFLERNPRLQIVFDRGDVAWLRAYCHLLTGLIDVWLSVDTQPYFELWGSRLFAKPVDAFDGTDEERWKKSAARNSVAIVEPVRLGRFRRHIIAVTELNEETWKHIRQETDDDHEWLPNPRQTGVLGLPVTDQQINAWLPMMRELKRLLEDEVTLPDFFPRDKFDRQLSLKNLLDDPPAEFRFDAEFPKNLGEKYFVKARPLNVQAFLGALQMFFNPQLMGYPVWFN